jgi:hypothetical protein
MENMKKRDWSFYCISLVSTLLVGAWFLFFFVSEFAARRLVHEDGVVEWLQVILFALAACYFFLIVKQHGSCYQSVIIQRLFILLLVGCLFVIGEEMSWGQRLLNLHPSDFIRRINKQDEFNFHNLRVFQPYRHWLLIGFGLIGLVGIASKNYSSRVGGSGEWSILFLPLNALALVFFYAVLGGLFVEWGDRLMESTDGAKFAKRFRFIAGRTSEIVEMFIAFAVFWYSFSLQRKFNDTDR